MKQIQDLAELSEWGSYYYEHSRPDLLLSAVRFMSKSGDLPDGAGVRPFLIAQIFRRYPKRIAGWVAEIEQGEIQQGEEDQQLLVAQALWLAGIPESLSELRRLSSGGSDRRQTFVARLLKESLPDLLAIGNIDFLWVAFFVTGETEPVERVIRLLPLVNVRGDTEKLLMGGAAQWSLTSNAVQHSRVMAICESYLKQASPEVRSVLEEVIGRAKKGEH